MPVIAAHEADGQRSWRDFEASPFMWQFKTFLTDVAAEV